jgi:hypothetical protein
MNRGPKMVAQYWYHCQQGHSHCVCSFIPFFSEGNVVDEKTPVETKKPYKAPVLSEYGDILQITQNSGPTGGMFDGVGSNKTFSNVGT